MSMEGEYKEPWPEHGVLHLSKGRWGERVRLARKLWGPGMQ